MRAALLPLLLFATCLAQAAAQPFVRVEIAPSGPVLVGEQVRVGVTVLAPNFFMSPAKFPLFNLPGAVVTLPDENALNGTETINGETYAGIRRSYLITPQQAGEFALPPAQIAFSYAAEPGRPAASGVVTLPPQRFVAQLPQGQQPSSAPSLVAAVAVTQRIDSDPRTVKVGGALTRTIETFAANTQAMMIPPPSFEAPAGVRVYRSDPVLTDVTSDRGDFLGGRRVDQVAYVFEQTGSYALPAIDVPWFNAQNKRQEVASAAEIDVTVAQASPTPSDLAPPAETAPPPHRDWRTAALWLLGLAIAALAVWTLRGLPRRLSARAAVRRRAREMSEPAAFARLQRACRAGDAAAAYREFGVWARRQGFASIEAFCEREPALAAATTALERRLYAAEPSNTTWNGQVLFAGAKIVRSSQRRVERRSRRRPARLPPLNPP